MKPSRFSALNILGRKWSVVWDYKDARYYGQSDMNPGRISIRPDLGSFMERDTLLHEVLHSILRQQGRPYRPVEEEYVNALATGLTAVLDSNPKLRKYLCAN